MTDHKATGRKRTGGHLLIDQLAVHGAEMVFGVPGESYLEALDAFHDRDTPRFIVCRQEGGAAMMADAYGKLTGRPGIAFATRGPGATNASAGVHIAFQDSTPMILLIGQVGRDTVEREAFQEIDYRRMYGQIAKWVAEIDDARRIPEFLSRAFYTAISGRPGPVVLALPEDMLTDEVEAKDAPPYKPVEIGPSPEDMERLNDLLASAARPIAIIGGGGWSEAARIDFQIFAAAHELPVAVSFRCQDYFDNRHPCYAGHAGVATAPALAERIKDADLLLTVGARLGEMTTSGYTLVDIPRPRQRLVHVYPDPEEIGRVYAPELGIVATSAAFARSTNHLNPRHASREAAVRSAHAAYAAHSQLTRSPGNVQLSEIVRALRERLPDDTIVCNGAGNYAVWVHRFWDYRMFRTQLGPTSGSMGYGVPAAVAAKLKYPERTVIAFAGDGCYFMTGQEFLTAVQYSAPIIVIVCNNAMYGTIRMHQERHHPERISGTDLVNPDFAALARACGGFGATVERTEDFPTAFDEAQASGLPAIIELKIDPEALTPAASLSEIRRRALEARDSGR
jgi:acetolactate synthase I/II/III large subunit